MTLGDIITSAAWLVAFVTCVVGGVRVRRDLRKLERATLGCEEARRQLWAAVAECEGLRAMLDEARAKYLYSVDRLIEHYPDDVGLEELRSLLEYDA